VLSLLSSWIPCILFAAAIILGVPLLCLLAGDDEPANETAHESGSDGEQQEPDELPAAA
jgi:hypothetical protein